MRGSGARGGGTYGSRTGARVDGRWRERGNGRWGRASMTASRTRLVQRDNDLAVVPGCDDDGATRGNGPLTMAACTRREHREWPRCTGGCEVVSVLRGVGKRRRGRWIAARPWRRQHSFPYQVVRAGDRARGIPPGEGRGPSARVGRALSGRKPAVLARGGGAPLERGRT